MPFDGIVMKSVVEELQLLVDGRVNKIYEPSNNELIITIRNNRKNFPLLLSIHPNYARLHITEQSFQNPDEPPMFCMVLRKHLNGATVKSIEQYDLERIIFIHFQARDEIGDEVTKSIAIELMGKHSNIILLNEHQEKIIHCKKHVPPSQNRFRTLLPGADYQLPPSQNKLNILTTDSETFVKKLDFNAGKIDKQIVQHLAGFSPRLAKEFLNQAHLGNENTYKKIFSSFQQAILEKNYEFFVYKNDKEDFHVIKLTHIEKASDAFSTASEMLDHFYANKAERDQVRQIARDLSRKISNELSKSKRKLKIHEKTLKKADNASRYQKLGELLTAHLHLVKKGDESVNVIDYYDPDQQEITIELKTDKTPSENAQIFFNRYRKMLTAKKKSKVEILKTNNEINYLEDVLQFIESARVEDIEEIREELRREGYLKRNVANRRRRRSKPKPEQFTSTDGTTIYVGKNNTQNEYVTHRLANKEDIWLHTLDIPGSHVVIKSNHPSEQTILEAAQLAAYYSKARQSASVPVDYTKIKHVKKPSGSKPGYVTYDNQKTVFVTPDKEVVDKLVTKNN